MECGIDLTVCMKNFWPGLLGAIDFSDIVAFWVL